MPQRQFEEWVDSSAANVTMSARRSVERRESAAGPIVTKRRQRHMPGVPLSVMP